MSHKISYSLKYPCFRCRTAIFRTYPSRLSAGSNRLYSTKSEIRSLFEESAQKNNVSQTTDWYQVDYGNLDSKTSEAIKKYFSGSVYRALSTAYPEVEWLPWRFKFQNVPQFRFQSVSSDFWKEQSNQRKFFDDLGQQLGIQNLDDWYQKLALNVLFDNGGGKLLRLYNNSPTDALMTAHPEHNWVPWKFNILRAGFWKSMENQTKFFDWLGKELGIKQLDDWYQKLSSTAIQDNGGSQLLAMYEQSPASALIAAYPEHNWLPWKFTNIKYSKQDPRKYFDWLGQQLDVKQLDDWYQKLSKDIMLQNGGHQLLNLYKNSPTNALQAAYPEHNWILSNFNWSKTVTDKYAEPAAPVKISSSQVKPNVSPVKLPSARTNQKPSVKLEKKLQDTSASNQQSIKEALEQYAKANNLNSNDWYQVTIKSLDDGTRLLIKKEFSGSLYRALCAAYPGVEWHPWKFKSVPKNYWKDPSNQRKFFDELGKKLEVQTLDDWYDKLSKSAVLKNGGTLLRYFSDSPVNTLMAVYPEHNWVSWKFNKAGKGVWSSQDNIKQFLAELSEKLSIQTLDDWYRVDRTQLESMGAITLRKRYKGLYNLLKEQYPHHPWDRKRFYQASKKGQRWLTITLKKMFPNEEILEDYIHPKATFSSSGRPMQLDVFIPSKNIAFEYQGKHHYEEVGVFGPSKIHQQRDEEKRALCAANNIKLIEVPYWWNRTQEQLQAMMHKSLL